MAEMPLVIVDVQRGGPSTGMPTNVEQSDLNIACFGGHGDSPRVVVAPANVEDCFYTAIEAVNIARKYSVPVIMLTDQAIATRIEAFEEPDLEVDLPGHFAGSLAGGGSQAVRSFGAGRRVATCGAGHPDRQWQISDRHRDWSTTNWGIPRVRRSCTCR
jgi:hypothetical protein